MVYVVYISIFLSLLFLSLGIFSEKEIRKKIPTEEEFNEDFPKIKKIKWFFLFLKPIIPLNTFILNKLPQFTKKINDMLQTANTKLLPEEFLLIKEIIVVLGLFFYNFSIKKIFPQQMHLFWLIGLVGIGFILPDLLLKSHIARRKRLIVKYLPDAIDLMYLCVNAGLDFGVAIKRIVDKSKPNPMVEELNTLLLETRMGKSRIQALKDMASRLDLPEISAFSRALIQAEQLGTPLESALSILSEEIREYRFRRAERQALKAPLKLLIPLVFCILPVVLIIVGGPILLQFLKGELIPGFK